MVRTLAFQAGNAGSIPARATKPRLNECCGGCGLDARGYDDRSLPTCGEWPCGTDIVRQVPVKTMKPDPVIYAAAFPLTFDEGLVQ